MVVHGVLWIVGNAIQARISFGEYNEDKARVGSNCPAPALKAGEHPPYHCTRIMMYIVQMVGLGFYIACKNSLSVAEWLERSFRACEARVRFPAESSQMFQIVC